MSATLHRAAIGYEHRGLQIREVLGVGTLQTACWIVTQGDRHTGPIVHTAPTLTRVREWLDAESTQRWLDETGAPGRRTINTISDLPADGMITVKRWDRTRRQGWHIERILHPEDTDMVRVSATPVNIATGQPTGEPRAMLLRFGLDAIEVMP